MNPFLKISVQNQILQAENFVSVCNMDAKKDDNKISPEEAKALKQIEKAVAGYTKALAKIIK